jgi:hypothetical protein
MFMHIVRYISAGMIWFFLCCFLFSVAHAQESKQRKYSLELHILEPSMLVLNRSISKNGNWSVVLGAGLSGMFYSRYLEDDIRYGYIGRHYSGTAYAASIRKYFYVLHNRRLGILLQSGLQYRRLETEINGIWVGLQPIKFNQLIPYIRAGIFYRLSKKFELGTMAGVGIHVYDVTGIAEFMASGYIGYKLGWVKPK